MIQIISQREDYIHFGEAVAEWSVRWGGKYELTCSQSRHTATIFRLHHHARAEGHIKRKTVAAYISVRLSLRPGTLMGQKSIILILVFFDGNIIGYFMLFITLFKLNIHLLFAYYL